MQSENVSGIKLIGIGGFPRSGKDTLAELFIQAGYFGVSFGDILRDFARKRHADKQDPLSVANMTETSNWLRETRGSDVILQEALRQFRQQQANGTRYTGLVLWSIRAPVEVDFLCSHHSELIWIEASTEVRYRRALQHLRTGEEPITLAEFERQELLQWKPQPGIAKEIQMDLSYVKQNATRVLANNSEAIEQFLNESRQLIEQLAQTEQAS